MEVDESVEEWAASVDVEMAREDADETKDVLVLEFAI